MLYAPLFMAGPIMTFQDFIAQLHRPVRTITTRETALYAARLVGCILLMEFFMHTLYVVAIKDTGTWTGFTPFQIAMIGFFNLKYIWLKLLIIWRFFRLWAMLDGVECVENMTRCMTTHFSAMGFWKHWHRSYNRWLIRYLYIPLGGSARYAYNIWPIFTFVAVWHDIELRLLVWGWLIALFILPEYVLTRIFATPLVGAGCCMVRACAGLVAPACLHPPLTSFPCPRC
jgi:D-alanyl-lipoteichoic acid acyltransferase DltB (MBOAT superfamily)